VLENAGLVRVVRTRKVRALTEMYYGRVARLFVLKSDESMPDELRSGTLSALMLRHAADELIASGDESETAGFVNVRLTEADVRRFENRLNRLMADLQRADRTDGVRHVLAYALFSGRAGLPPRGDDG
jgi:hypothetical protein